MNPRKLPQQKLFPVCIASFVCLVLSSGAIAQHPGPQPRPGPSAQIPLDKETTLVITPEGFLPLSDPYVNPPGLNLLLTVNSNMFDGNGVEMPNTLPSSPGNPYNLHDGPVIVTEIDPTSAANDLLAILRALRAGSLDAASVQRAIDILEGNPVPDRVYSGIPVLHYKGPEKVKAVEPIFDDQGVLVGGNVNVHQIWYDTHIESDTAFIDPSAVMGVPWTVTYTVDVLDRGHDDFSPFVMYFDDPALSAPGMPPMPHVAMDQTFFPMEAGTRNVFKIKMSRGKYFNLVYTWGWRVHPPRVQVMENALKKAGGKTLPQWEIDVFGSAPSSSETAKLAAIAMIGDRSPAKRMWLGFHALAPLVDDDDDHDGDHEEDEDDDHQASRTVKRSSDSDDHDGNENDEDGDDGDDEITALLDEIENAYHDWFNRTKLPSGVTPDPESDLTLFYTNNTIYGQFTDKRTIQRWFEWTSRPGELRVTLLNDDRFVHGYMNVDFGGSRGWENQFHSTVPLGGSGCWFSFGRVHWWVNAGGPWGAIMVPPSTAKGPGKHRVWLTLNFDPSRRLRIYQFDPLHHDTAVFSVH